jgi:5-amino-6-(5-phosphoribosylamino)uracil reductase
VRLVHPAVRDVTSEDLFDLYDLPGPHLRAGFVASVDGVVAIDGRSGPLGSPADKAAFRALRTVSDAVVVGAGTARAEDYGPVRHSEAAAGWRAAHGRDAITPIVVVSRHGHLDPTARLLAGPVVLAVPEGVDVDVDVDVIRTTDPLALRQCLHERGWQRLLCEGGPTLLTSLLQAGAVDELCLTTAPTTIGSGPRMLTDTTTSRFELRSLVVDDPGVLLARWSVVPSGA